MLWLKSIQHTGHVGGTISLPKVEFGGEELPNRVDAAPGVPVMWRPRLSSIKTETGAIITITYSAPQCTPHNLPSNAHTNSMRCYPVRWTPEFFTEPIEDWFHKYVVTSVVETDTTGGMPAVETYYEYATSGGGTSVLWAWDDAEFTEDEHRTYNQWRGYAQVTTKMGDPAEGQTRTRARFYRGLHGQPLPSGGTRTVNLTDAESNPVVDHEALAGAVYESLAYDGNTIISGGTTEYWTRKTATQQRDHDGGDLKAWLTGVSVEQSRVRLVSSTWQRAETRISYDNQGRQIRVNDLGDLSQNGDETCTRIEYADNLTAWIKDTVKRIETVGVDCGTTPSRPDDVISDDLVYFDGANTHGATPSQGAPTRVDVLDDWDGGPVYATTARMAYDPLGRIIESTDALDNTSTTAYTPAGAGPLTQKVSTNPLGHTSTTELGPAWGLPIGTIDPNNRRVDLAYDALGRSTAVWLPARDPATHTPSLEFEYLVRDHGPSAVTSRTMNHAQAYVSSVVLYDSLLRERQSQTETADHGRLLTEIVYDTQGRVDETFGPNHHTDPPGTSIVRVREEDSARRIGYVYDGAGRVTDEIFYNKHVERWRTVTSYGGSSAGFLVTVHPPDGAPATATITNARGETVEKRTYRSNLPSGTFDALHYEYDPAGRMVGMTDQVGNEWSWEYDLRGRQVAAHDPDAGTTTMTYDVAGQLTSSTDARGETIVNDYDPLGRQISRHDGDDTLLAEWEYDTAINGIGMLGKSIRWVDGEAYINETVAVNPLGLVSQSAITIPASEGPLAGRHFFTQNYYPNGQVAGQGLQDVGDLERGSLSWMYDHVGNPTRLIYQGRFSGVTVVVDEATFTPFGEVQTRRLGAGNARHAYHGFVYEEGTRRLERATFDRQATIPEVADLRYSYDPAGNVLSIADVPAGLPANHELQCFHYDAQQRLVEAWAQDDTTECAATPSSGVLGGPGPYWHSYSHDPAGNRTSETLRVPGQSPVTRDYSYPGHGQPRPHAVQQVTTVGTGEQIEFTYDQAGNTTSRDDDGEVLTLQWDAEGRVEEVDDDGDTIRMVYDADGNRLIRDDGDSVTAFLPLTELTWDRSTNTVDGVRYFSHAGQVVAICTGQDPADWTFLGVDHHGTTTTHSVNAFTAVEQVRRMDPYGNPRGVAPQVWPGQQGFVGGVEDPTGLVQVGARSYDPDTGRFLSVDPILALGDGQQINGYAYANNNPITFTDPTGLCSQTPYGPPLCGGNSWSDVHKGGITGTSVSGHGAAPARGPRANPSHAIASPARNIPLSEKFAEFSFGAQAGFNNWGSDFAKATTELFQDPLVQAGFSPWGVMAMRAWKGTVADWKHWMKETWDPKWATICVVLAPFCEIMESWDNGNYYQAGYELGGLLVEAILAAAVGAATRGVGGAGTRVATQLNRLARRGFCSFTADTPVLMADGSTKPIFEVQPGDEVVSTDPDTGDQSAETVVAVWVHEDEVVDLQVYVAGDRSIGNLLGGDFTLATISTTADHPFWNHTDQQWQPATTLDPGDQLLTVDATTVTVTGLLPHTQRHTTAYNLTITTTHTYYVVAGDTPVLVHNSNGCLPVLRNWSSQRFQFGNETFLLDKKGMEHILTRHHPEYWDGSVKARQTFFDSGMSVDDVQSAILGVMQQNRGTLIQNGTNDVFRVRGTINGTEYVLGINKGRVAQFYPVR